MPMAEESLNANAKKGRTDHPAFLLTSQSKPLMPTQINDTASIDLEETIGLVLTPAPGTAISNVEWVQTNEIGTITPGETPETATFKPSAAGTTGIYAKCQVAIL
jgi:hypothetical protein